MLHQIRVEPDGTTVASDGKALLAVEPCGEVEGVLPEFEDEVGVGEDGIGLPPKLVEKVLKNIPKGNLGLELGYAVITGCSEDSVELSTTDLQIQSSEEAGIVRKRFPEWLPILRKVRRSAGTRVCVDRSSLIILLQTLESACKDPQHKVFIELGDEGLLLRAESVNTGQRVMGYMLPYDTDGEWLQLTKWERKVCGLKRKKKTK